MTADPTKPYGVASQTWHSTNTDNNEAPLALGRRGEQLVQVLSKPAYRHADEGRYFMATNPTPGTGIAGIAATGAFADAESLLFVRNFATAAEGTRIYLDYLRLTVTAAGANGSDVRYVSKLDTGATRIGSGGSAITPVNVNMQSTETTKATVQFGAVASAAASSAARLISNGLVRNVIAVVGDVYTFDFGGQPALPAAHAVAGAAVANILIKHPPVVLGPTDQFVFSIHQTAQTAASSFELELGYWER